MKHFLTYVKYSYDLIVEAEIKTSVNLDHEIERFVVHTFAKYLDHPNIPTDTIAIKMLKTINEHGVNRKLHFQQIAEECLLIDGLSINENRWPSKIYFKDMGKLALEYRAYSENPPDLLYTHIAKDFDKISFVLSNVKEKNS
jgi:hypothetical protein